MATPVQNAPKLEIGKLTAEDAERFASMFRPIWELDDAPFADGTKLTANDMDTLASGAGVAADVYKTEISAAKVEVEIDVEPDATPAPPAAPAAPQVAQAKPQPPPAPVTTRAKDPYVPPKAPPVAVRMPAGDSGEYAPVKKSNTGLILAAVGVLLVGGGIFAVKTMMGSKTEAQAPSATTATATHEETHIPPPPPETAAAANNDTKPAATTPPAATAAPTQEDIKPVPAAMGTTPVETHAAPVSTHAAAAVNTGASAGGAPHPAATHHATGGAPAGGGGRHGAIVRDNPF